MKFMFLSGVILHEKVKIAMDLILGKKMKIVWKAFFPVFSASPKHEEG